MLKIGRPETFEVLRLPFLLPALLLCAALVPAGAGLVHAVPPAGYGQPAGEFDITLSRVPIPERPAAKAMKPPFEPTPEILAEGKALFLGRGTCFQCHGPEGKGDGGAAKILPIQPRDFTNPKFNKVRTPGEMMWVLKNGSLGQTGNIPGTGMLPIVGQFLSEEDGWKVLLYERSLGEAK
jgi:mono/diheme cytochrome c family protein